MTRVGCIDAVANGTADEGATGALWHVVKLLNGRAAVELTPPPPG